MLKIGFRIGLRLNVVGISMDRLSLKETLLDVVLFFLTSFQL